VQRNAAILGSQLAAAAAQVAATVAQAAAAADAYQAVEAYLASLGPPLPSTAAFGQSDSGPSLGDIFNTVTLGVGPLVVAHADTITELGAGATCIVGTPLACGIALGLAGVADTAVNIRDQRGDLLRREFYSLATLGLNAIPTIHLALAEKFVVGAEALVRAAGGQGKLLAAKAFLGVPGLVTTLVTGLSGNPAANRSGENSPAGASTAVWRGPSWLGAPQLQPEPPVLLPGVLSPWPPGPQLASAPPVALEP
jgi:hypothetical protein